MQFKKSYSPRHGLLAKKNGNNVRCAKRNFKTTLLKSHFGKDVETDYSDITSYPNKQTLCLL